MSEKMSRARERLTISWEKMLSTPAVGAKRQAPSWLRPFFSLRVQLFFAFSLVLMFVVTLICTFIYGQTSPIYITLVALTAILLGGVAALLVIGLLLRPLWRVTDAAQAIASGDFEQRGRLPLRLPPQDEIDRLAGSLNEMVKRLEYSEEVKQATELRFQRFFSDASHQLRTPLTSIRGFTELLMRGMKDDPEMAQHVLKRMKSEAERMTHLINDLLTLARLDNSQPLKTQYVDLVELAIEEVEQTRHRVNDGRHVWLDILTQKRLGMHADRDRIKQLLFILLDNAVKHGRPAPEGTVTLQLDQQDRQAIIRVIDNGNGINKADLNHIFDSFYRGQYRQSNQPPPSGIGLGLTIAHAIVHAHRGSIAVDSDAGKGTEFTIALPCIN